MATSKLRWLDPGLCDPPHKVTRPEQVQALAAQFAQAGWDQTHPALVGYWKGNVIQLLSGTHRQAAAIQAGIRIPVVIWSWETIDKAWGTGFWADIMASGNKV